MSTKWALLINEALLEKIQPLFMLVIVSLLLITNVIKKGSNPLRRHIFQLIQWFTKALALTFPRITISFSQY